MFNTLIKKFLNYISVLGGTSRTTWLGYEADKFSVEFTVASAQTVKAGQPVKLANDGTITPWAAADGESKLIGYCIEDHAAGELCTVISRGFSLIYAITPAGALNCGPIGWGSYDSSTSINGALGYNVVAALGGGGANVTEQIGWLLDASAGANTLVRVLLKN